MANCDNCGAQGVRIRSRWTDKGVRLADQCTSCAPGSFEAIKSVRDGQITMGHEYMPTMYRKTEAGYVAKDELLADTEAQIADSIANSDANVAFRKALEKKRQTRRTKAMTPAEHEACINRVNSWVERA